MGSFLPINHITPTLSWLTQRIIYNFLFFLRRALSTNVVTYSLFSKKKAPLKFIPEGKDPPEKRSSGKTPLLLQSPENYPQGIKLLLKKLKWYLRLDIMECIIRPRNVFRTAFCEMLLITDVREDIRSRYFLIKSVQVECF